MKITVCNRKKVYSATRNAESPFALIQFCDPEYDAATYFHEGCHTRLLFKVHDVDTSGYTSIPFSSLEATHVIKKIVEKANNFNEIICQCDAGISRSSGCAAALALILNGSDEEIFSQKRYVPNRLIYRSILNAYEDTLEVKENG